MIDKNVQNHSTEYVYDKIKTYKINIQSMFIEKIKNCTKSL